MRAEIRTRESITKWLDPLMFENRYEEPTCPNNQNRSGMCYVQSSIHFILKPADIRRWAEAIESGLATIHAAPRSLKLGPAGEKRKKTTSSAHTSQSTILDTPTIPAAHSHPLSSPYFPQQSTPSVVVLPPPSLAPAAPPPSIFHIPISMPSAFPPPPAYIQPPARLLPPTTSAPPPPSLQSESPVLQALGSRPATPTLTPSRSPFSTLHLPPQLPPTTRSILSFSSRSFLLGIKAKPHL